MKKDLTFSAIKGVDPNWRIGIVASTYYKEEIDALTKGAIKTLVAAGIKRKNISIYEAPGSFEIPLIGAAVAEADKADALMGFGIIVEGATQHARLLAESATRGIMETQLTYLMPFAFEILYVDSIELARERTKGKHNKGIEAANAVLKALVALERAKA